MICCRFRRLDFGKTILAGICPFSLLYLTKTTSYQLMIWKR